MDKHTEAKVIRLPKCDFCDEVAGYDFRTSMRPWAYGCEKHWIEHRAEPILGLGIGQKLVKLTEG